MDEINKIDLIEVKEIGYQGGLKKMLINPNASLDDVYGSEYLPEFLKTILEKWLTWQERSEIDFASSISSLALAPQWYAGLLAWGCWIVLEDSMEINIRDFAKNRGKKADIKQICIPLDVVGRTFAEAAVCRTPRDFPIVFTAVVVDFENKVVKDAKLAMTGASKKSVYESGSVKTIIGKALTDEAIESLQGLIGSEIEPKADFRGSVEYRKEMTSVLTKRVLESCLKEAN